MNIGATKTPDTPGEEATFETAKQVADSQQWYSRDELAARIAENSSVAKSTAKSHLSTFRKYFEENGLETKDDPENQGSATVYWRLAEGDKVSK